MITSPTLPRDLGRKPKIPGKSASKQAEMANLLPCSGRVRPTSATRGFRSLCAHCRVSGPSDLPESQERRSKCLMVHAKKWTCENCGVSISQMNGEQVALPETWISCKEGT